jgi:hypothetical protein
MVYFISQSLSPGIVIADLIGKLLNTTEDLMFNKSFGQLLVFGFAVSLPISLAMAADKTAPKTDKLSSADEKFVKEAAAGGMMEVELGKLAVDKSANDKVKGFWPADAGGSWQGQ